MSKPLKVLVIEDDPADFLLLERSLQQQGLLSECQRVSSDVELDAALQNEIDVVLADYKIPGMDFRVTLRRIQKHYPDLPVILVSGTVGEETAVELLRMGLTDFIFKDHLIRLPDAIRRAIDDVANRRAILATELKLHERQAINLEEQRQARLAALNLMEDAIAAREHAEKSHVALQESESKYRLVSENASEFIFWLGMDGRFKYASLSCERIFGHPPEEFLSDPELMINLLHPDDRAAYWQHLADNAEADVADLEFRFLDKNGAVRWISHHCQPMYDENSMLIGRRGSNRDITERKNAEAERDFFSDALRQSSQPILLADTDFRITYINPAFTSLFGYQMEDLVGKEVSSIVPNSQAHRSEHEEIVQQLLSAGNWSGEVDRQACDGTLIPSLANIARINDKEGKTIGMLASYIDLRPMREKDSRLRKLSLAVEQSPESVIITNLDGNIEYVNESFIRNSGYDRDEIIGQNPRILHSGKTPKSTYDALWKNLTEGKIWQGEFCNKRKDGSEYFEHAIISPIHQPDGRITHYLAVQEDITGKKHSEAEIHRLGFYDTLTGLPNRALLLERAAQTLSTTRRVRHYSALISFNIDRFKTFNDAGGQPLGDAILKAVGERLAHALRDGDVVARIAGDEFGILLNDLAPKQQDAAHLILHVSEKIHASLNEPFILGDENIALTAGLGIAIFPESENDTPLDILRRANTALHHAKTKGSGQTSFFEGTLDQMAKQRFTVERELHQAIASGELRVYLQPQVNAAGMIVGAEALVRWQHPQRGLIPPAAFIPIAEDSNLIIEIGTWVYAEVCRLLARDDMATIPLRIAVNISPRHFRHPDFISQIKHELAFTGADPTHLTLEITEGMVIDNINDVISKMTELSSMGIHFSMDDFGTGYSSLSYLKRLPIHELKIDKSFIQDVTTDLNDAALVETILAVANMMHLKVVAEGVETAEQAAFLNQRSTVIHQGYFFGKPEPAEDLLAKIIKNRSSLNQ